MENSSNQINDTATERQDLEAKLNSLVQTIGKIPIASNKIMPFGWRKAAKGRTVWRIIEEIISQNLEVRAAELGFKSAIPADSEVGVYDFQFQYPDGDLAFVNIKSAVYGGRKNKDDISKADGLKAFYKLYPDSNLYVATFVLEFNDDMTITIKNCLVMPVAWIPDIYINPSNNGNLQSSQYKNLENAVRRTNSEFVALLDAEYEVSRQKRNKRLALGK